MSTPMNPQQIHEMNFRLGGPLSDDDLEALKGRQPIAVIPDPYPQVSALLAQKIRRVEELELACARAVNWIDNAQSGYARDALLTALGAPPEALAYPDRSEP